LYDGGIFGEAKTGAPTFLLYRCVHAAAVRGARRLSVGWREGALASTDGEADGATAREVYGFVGWITSCVCYGAPQWARGGSGA
jgi:hypothetical protein